MPEILAASWPPLWTYCPILPQISTQQALFLLLDCQEAFYGGAVGGGKTAALLMAALQYVDVPGYAALILRTTFAELEQPNNVIPISMQWFSQSPEPVRPSYNRGDHRWTFPSGAEIVFGHLQHPDAMIRYQGGGYHFVGFDELTHFEERAYEFIGFSRTRKPPTGPLSEVPIRIRATANPGGPGHGWVKRRFIDQRDPSVGFVPAKVWDNPGIDAEDYVARLSKLDETFRQQLLDGDWGAFEGAAFQIGPEHLVDPFEIPEHFERAESMDYGLNNPTAWIAWAIDYDGNLIAFDSYYQPALPSESAAAILALRTTWGSRSCVGDPNSLAMRTGGVRRFGEPATIESEFADAGVDIARGNDNPRAGYVRIRELLTPDPQRRFPDWHPRRGEFGSPRLFVVEQHCPQLVEQLRTAPLQPADKRHGGEMVDPVWESRHGHALAAARYFVLSRPSPSEQPGPQFDDTPEGLRAEFLHRHETRRDKLRAIKNRFVNV